MKEATIRFRCSSLLRSKLEALAATREQTLSDFIRAQMVDYVAAQSQPADYPQRVDHSALHAAEDPPRQKKRRKVG